MAVFVPCDRQLQRAHYSRYANVMDNLQWNTLEMRRKYRLTLMNKLTHGLVDINSGKHLIQVLRGSHERKPSI